MEEGQKYMQKLKIDFKVEKGVLEPRKSVGKCGGVASNVKRTWGCSWIEGVPFNGPKHSRTAMVNSN